MIAVKIVKAINLGIFWGHWLILILNNKEIFTALFSTKCLVFFTECWIINRWWLNNNNNNFPVHGFAMSSRVKCFFKKREYLINLKLQGVMFKSYVQIVGRLASHLTFFDKMSFLWDIRNCLIIIGEKKIYFLLLCLQLCYGLLL